MERGVVVTNAVCGQKRLHETRFSRQGDGIYCNFVFFMKNFLKALWN